MMVRGSTFPYLLKGFLGNQERHIIKLKQFYCTKRLVVSLIVLISTGFYSCSEKYDDEAIWQKVNELTDRIQKLEDTCNQMNTNIASVQVLLDAMKENQSIVSVTPLDKDKGYVMKFSNGESITLYNGIDGTNGTDGADGISSQISIQKLNDGEYCWVLNGEVIKDSDGNPILANGKNGEDGKDGASATIPQIKTGSQLKANNVEGVWENDGVYITVNNGGTWTKISANDGSSIFKSINIDEEGQVTFTLFGGSVISVPRTDELFSSLIGTWNRANGYSEETLVLNNDNTYQRIYSSYTENDTFELFPETGIIIFSDNGFCMIIDVTEDRLMVRRSESDGIGIFNKVHQL